MRAQGAPDSGPDAGASCATSDDCALPTPYCDAGRHACVECLSDRNCAATTGLCDVSQGVCVACFSDLDCGSPTPYCSQELERCVECLADANCGDQGIACVDGECGSCGDGICGPKERFIFDDYGPFSEDRGTYVLCPEDCATFCESSSDLGSALGRDLATVETGDLRNTVGLPCGGFDGPDAWFTWTAPETGTYWLDAIGSTQPIFLYVLAGECGGFNGWGCSPQGDVAPEGFRFQAGVPTIILLDTESTADGTFVLSILDHCEGGADLCPGGPGGAARRRSRRG